MERRMVTVSERGGLHLRNAAAFMQRARRFQSKISICKGCECADSCSILQMLALAVGEKSEVTLVVEGPDEKEAVQDLAKFFSDGAGI